MQSVCSLLPSEYAERVVEARARLSGLPAIGAIYDPPFAHFTHQLAEEYDWEGLRQAPGAQAKREKPISVRTSGVLLFSGEELSLAVAVFRSQQLADFQARVWDVVSAHAQGTIVGFYQPEVWLPHVTVKRCGKDPKVFGEAMSLLAQNNAFDWSMTVDNIAVQHDPGKNSRTHYLRLHFPLAG
ncbi:MAG: hypothetical protein EXR52_00970 [Dehalococcoidia bacterium]|nr:hypothetical protein [Dehalococcoidia bacterium]